MEQRAEWLPYSREALLPPERDSGSLTFTLNVFINLPSPTGCCLVLPKPSVEQAEQVWVHQPFLTAPVLQLPSCCLSVELHEFY